MNRGHSTTDNALAEVRSRQQESCSSGSLSRTSGTPETGQAGDAGSSPVASTKTFRAIEVYKGSNGEVTQAFYKELEKRGPIGALAVNLFRAQKTSERAKQYRGGIRGQGSYRGMSYGKKNWSLENICKLLAEYGDEFGVRWGWKYDPNTPGYSWVLYVDLPDFGQCSYHSETRLSPQNYTGDWDGRKGATVQVVIDFADWVLTLKEVEVS